MAFELPQLEVYKTTLVQIAQVMELLAMREMYVKIAEEEHDPEGYRPAIENTNKKIEELLKLDWGGKYHAS